MAFKKRCRVCGSRKWHKVPSSGMVMCSEGHILQEYRNETNEATEFSQHALKKRTLKSQRVRKKKQSLSNPILYHGDRARFHYFQCLQILLRIQIKELAQMWSLPQEFEVLCRDLWALHLGSLPTPVPAEPFLYTQEEEGDSQPTNILHKSDGRRSPQGDSSSSTESEEEEDPEMEDLLLEASESDSSDDEKDEQGTQLASASRKAAASTDNLKSRKRWSRNDSPAGNIAVLFCACYCLRMPVIYRDMIDLIGCFKLPYLDPLRLLPDNLTRHLTRQTKQALSPHHPPTPILLHKIASQLITYTAKFGISCPELNAGPVLWRAVRHMGGNPTLYTVAKTLARYLEIPLTLSSASVHLPAKSSDTAHRSDNVPPELAVVATVLVGLKLIYGFNGKNDVQPKDGWDPACTMPSKDAYLTMVNEMKCSEASVMDGGRCMHEYSDNEIDEYISFCERALLSPESSSRSSVEPAVSVERQGQQLPAQGSPQSSASNGGKDVHLAMKLGRLGDRPPGSGYCIYSSQDILGTLPDELAAVVDRAGWWTGMSSEEVLSVTERFERRLLRFWSRRDRNGGASGINSNDNNNNNAGDEDEE